MKKLLFAIMFVSVACLISCGDSSTPPPAPMDSVKAATSNAYDSAANNTIVPPSAAPSNATNSSLADTAYKYKDSTKKKK